MSTDIFRRYLDLLNEERGPAPTEFKPTHFHKNFLGGKIPLMQTPDGSFWWMTTATSDDGGPVEKGGGRKSIQPWIGDTTDLSSLASVDGVIKDGKPVEFPDGTTWKDNADGQNAETSTRSAASSAVKADGSAASRIGKKDGDGVDFRTGELKGDGASTSSDSNSSAAATRDSSAAAKSGGGLPDLVFDPASNSLRPRAEVAAAAGGDAHCAQCGTSKSMHQGLRHDFVQGNDARPDPVSQTDKIGGNEKADRIRKMQEELKKAGADLGNFGPDGNGIDGVIGKVTQAAMAKYPEIATKYPELASGGGENKETKVDLTKLNTALGAIEGILKKYKVNINEDRNSLTPADQMKNWRALMEASPGYDQYGNETGAGYDSTRSTRRADPSSVRNREMPRMSGANLTPAQQAAQRAGLGMPRLAGVPAFGSAGSSAAGSSALKGAAGAVGKGVARLSPVLGAALAIPDVYSRAKEGDYVGAGISTLAGLASFFPLAGTAAALGLTGLNYYLDSNKTPTVDISAEDAKIIGDNIKIIQDWQKDPANKDALTTDLKTRIANDLKGVATLGVPTQGSEPAPADAPAADPAGGSKNAIPAVAADLNTTLDNMDKFLAKHQFESVRKDLLKNQHLLSETERMALHRDLLKEDWSDWLPDLAVAAGFGAGAAGVAARQTATAAPASAIPTPPPSVFKSLLSKAWSAIKFVGRGAARVGWWGALIAGGVAAKSFWDWIRSDPHAASAAGLTPQEMAEWQQLDDQLQRLIPDRETFDALPFESQKKAMLINERRVKFMAWVAQKAEQQAQQPPK